MIVISALHILYKRLIHNVPPASKREGFLLFLPYGTYSKLSGHKIVQDSK
ncbi:hypothetical protein QF041_000138 [Paenibacillus sp. W2I17]|nr:hypothetical protein [Paenibacillus sp. W2I17]